MTMWQYQLPSENKLYIKDRPISPAHAKLPKHGIQIYHIPQFPDSPVPLFSNHASSIAFPPSFSNPNPHECPRQPSWDLFTQTQYRHKPQRRLTTGEWEGQIDGLEVQEGGKTRKSSVRSVKVRMCTKRRKIPKKEVSVTLYGFLFVRHSSARYMSIIRTLHLRSAIRSLNKSNCYFSLFDTYNLFIEHMPRLRSATHCLNRSNWYTHTLLFPPRMCDIGTRFRHSHAIVHSSRHRSAIHYLLLGLDLDTHPLSFALRITASPISNPFLGREQLVLDLDTHNLLFESRIYDQQSIFCTRAIGIGFRHAHPIIHTPYLRSAIHSLHNSNWY